jgi:hypothetical protein
MKKVSDKIIVLKNKLNLALQDFITVFMAKTSQFLLVVSQCGRFTGACGSGYVA